MIGVTETSFAEKKAFTRAEKHQHEVRSDRDVPVTMRDGTVLRADIYSPKAAGKFPVLLKRTPYNKLEGDGVYTPEFGWLAAQSGYIVVVQDCRGRFHSEGEWYPFRDEGQDGYDTIEWAATLPQSNGSVGMFGDSYFAATAVLAALGNPPHLAAIFVVFPAADYGDGFPYQDGAFVQGLAEAWTSSVALNTLERRAQKQITNPNLTLPLGSYSVLDPAAIDGKTLAPYFFDWLRHPSFDAYWRKWSLEEHVASLDIPIYQVAGWYDLFLGGTLKHYGLIRNGAGKDARKNERLLIGPWSHGPLTRKQGELDFGEAADGDMQKLTLRWFDSVLKGKKEIANDLVRYFTMGINHWRNSNAWPLPNTNYQRLYLHSSKWANSLTGDGELLPTLPAFEKPSKYTYDPAHWVPTHGSASGPFDQRTIEKRQDVLVYTTPPFKDDVEVTGPVAAELYASSSAVDTDFTAKLVDVWPTGYAQNLTDGILRTRYRNSSTTPLLLTRGEIYKIRIDLAATSNMFQRGHRLRLEISSSNFPRYDRNLNTGEGLLRSFRMIAAMNAIYHDHDHPSALIVPIISHH